MASSFTISYESACDGGGHITLSVVVDGGPSRPRTFVTDELRGPLTQDERDQFILLATRIKIAGLTRAQARSTLQAGFTVAI